MGQLDIWHRRVRMNYRRIDRRVLSFGLLILRYVIWIGVVIAAIMEGSTLQWLAAIGLGVYAVSLTVRRFDAHDLCADHPVLTSCLDGVVGLVLIALAGPGRAGDPLLVTPILTFAIYFSATDRLGFRSSLAKLTATLAVAYAALVVAFAMLAGKSIGLELYNEVALLTVLGVVAGYAGVMLRSHEGLYAVASELQVEASESVDSTAVQAKVSARGAMTARNVLHLLMRGETEGVRGAMLDLISEGEAGGEFVLSEPASRRRIEELRLSVRETEVLRLQAMGHTPGQIAGQLFISPKTVDTHLNHIAEKTGHRSGPLLTALALRTRLVSCQDIRSMDARVVPRGSGK